MTPSGLVVVTLVLPMVLVESIEYKFPKCCPMHEVFDMESATCVQDQNGFSKIPINPYVENESNMLPLNVTSVPSAKFGLPNCAGDSQLIVLRPYNGDNSDYTVVFRQEEMKELGLLSTCPKLDPMRAKSEKYCFDHGIKQDSKIESSIAVVCGKPKTCIRTCCQTGEYWSNGTCLTYEKQPKRWRVQFSDDPNATYEEIFDHPCDSFLPYPLDEHDVEFKSNGQIVLDMTNYTYNQYCLNNLEKGNGYSKELLVCIVEGQDGPLQSWIKAIDFTLIPILMGISLGFLILLQSVIWLEKKERLYECLMLCNIWMMALMYLTSIILKTEKNLSGAPCEIIALLFHFAYMSAFFWLSAMSHFIWKAFKGSPRLQKQKYGFAHPKFKGYALFAFGCPALVSIVTIVLEHLPEETQDDFIAPRIRTETCQLGETREGLDIPKLWYFHLINIMNLLAILTFFMLFLCNMTMGLQNTQMLDKTDKDRTKRRNKMLKVIVKMFFVMGLTWIADMISWALQAKLTKYEIFNNKGLLYSALVFEIINSSQGVIMFLVVFFDNARIKMLKEKLSKRSRVKKSSAFSGEDPLALMDNGGGSSTSATNVYSRNTSNTSEEETRM